MDIPSVGYKSKCCVPGCKNRFKKRHRFPKDETLMKKWLENIKSPKLSEMKPQQIYNSYYVCNKHFAEEYWVPGTRRGLRRDAVPTLWLSEVKEERESVPSWVEQEPGPSHEGFLSESLCKVEVEDEQIGFAQQCKCCQDICPSMSDGEKL